MAVNLSMLAGAGAQFFDNNGNPLAGGKIFTYAAGTTTPQATYTTSAGNVAHTNPIVLNSAGRVVSGGEIWLTDAVSYKFVLETTTAITIATYDDVTGNGSGILAAFAAPSGASLVAGGVSMQRDAIVAINTTGMVDGSVIIAKGRDTAGDGGGGTFRYSSASAQAADGGTVFAPTGGGRLLRDGWTVFGYAGGVNVAWYGVKGDNVTNDSAAMALAIAAQEVLRCTLEVSAKAQIRIATALDMPPCLRITGKGAAVQLAPKFIAVGGVNIFIARDGFNSESAIFENLAFDSATTGTGTAFAATNTSYISQTTFRNCVFYSNLRFGIDAPIILCSFYDCDFGSYPGTQQNFTAINSVGTAGTFEPNANCFFKCVFRKSSAFYQINWQSYGVQWNFYACDFEENTCSQTIINCNGSGSINFYSGYIERNVTPYFCRIFGDLSIGFTNVVRLHGVQVNNPATTAIFKREIVYPYFDIQGCYGQLNCNVTQNDEGLFNQASDLENCYGNYFNAGTGSFGELATVNTTTGYNARKIKAKVLNADQFNAVQKLNVSVTAATTICTLLNPLRETGANWAGQVAVAALSGASITGNEVNTASYLLNISRGGLVDCVLINASGVIAGDAANHPSFTWTTNAGGSLIATPIGSTTGNFSFLISCIGMVKAV